MALPSAQDRASREIEERTRGSIATRRLLAESIPEGPAATDRAVAVLVRLLADPSAEVWQAAARSLGRVAARDESCRTRLEELVRGSPWRERSIAALAALASAAPETPIELPESGGRTAPAGAYLADLLRGRGSLADAAAALRGLPGIGAAGDSIDEVLLERATFAPPAIRRAAIECLARRPRPEGLEAARSLVREAGMWRHATVEDALEIGRSYPALVRFLAGSARSTGDREVARRTVEFLHDVYSGSEETLQRAILCELYPWALEDPDLPVVRGLFDGAGHRDLGRGSGDLLETIQGAVLARAYGRELGASCRDERQWRLHLAEGDFLAVGRRRKAGEAADADERRADDQGIAFLARLVLAEERAFHGLLHFFRSLDDYRALEPPAQAEILLGLEVGLSARIRLEGFGHAVDPFGRVSALRARLEAIDVERRCAFLVDLALRAHREKLPRLEEMALSTLATVLDDEPGSRGEGLRSVLALLASELQASPTLVDRLSTLAEVHADHVLAESGDVGAVLEAAYRVLQTDPPAGLLARIAQRARDERIGRLFRLLSRLRRNTRDPAPDPGESAAALAAFGEGLRELCHPDPGSVAGLILSLTERLRLLLRLPLLGGLEPAETSGWVGDLDALKRRGLLDATLDPRQFGHWLRDLEAEIETFHAVDFGNVRERLAALARVEEKVEAIERACRHLPKIEGRILSGICGKWKGEIDRTERFFLHLKSSVLSGDPVRRLSPLADDASVARFSSALHRFRVRFLVARYDMDRAHSLILRGPEADPEGVLADRSHGRLLATVTALLFLPYLFYGLGREVVGFVHFALGSLGLIGGAAFLALAGRRDPAAAIRLVLPRLLGAIVTWYFVIGLGQEIWVFTVGMDRARFAAIVTMTALCSFLYTYAEVSRYGDTPDRTRRKALTVFAIGLTQSFAVGTVLTSLLGPYMLGGEIHRIHDRTLFAIPLVAEVLGLPFFPTIVLAWSFTALFLGMFLNHLFDEKRMAEV